MSCKKVSNVHGVCPINGQILDVSQLIKVEEFITYCHSHLRTNLKLTVISGYTKTP